LASRVFDTAAVGAASGRLKHRRAPPLPPAAAGTAAMLDAQPRPLALAAEGEGL
jgi:hypothetical protein